MTHQGGRKAEQLGSPDTEESREKGVARTADASPVRRTAAPARSSTWLTLVERTAHQPPIAEAG